MAYHNNDFERGVTLVPEHGAERLTAGPAATCGQGRAHDEVRQRQLALQQIRYAKLSPGPCTNAPWKTSGP